MKQPEHVRASSSCKTKPAAQTRMCAPSPRPPPGRLKKPAELASPCPIFPQPPSQMANSCDPHLKPSRRSPVIGRARQWLPPPILLLLVLLWPGSFARAAGPPNGPNDYLLVARASGQARLPCLIGKQALCGEPYFIAWYKLNATSRQWSRIEARSLAAGEERPAGETAPLADRVQFVMPRTVGAPTGPSGCLPSDNHSLAPAGASGASQSLVPLGRQAAVGGQKSLVARAFDCGQLTISGLELTDEGQYKCEITFSDSLDFDSCPASTTTQLNVIARPNEPEILLNGRLLLAAGQTITQTAGSGGGGPGHSTFKEGAQVRLECQSAGGKPAPRIEWLNLTSLAGDNDDQSMGASRAAQLHLMRAYWPVKRTTTSTSSGHVIAPLGAGDPSQAARAPTPVTSSVVSFTLSRFDMRSRFVCLVVPELELQRPGGAPLGLAKFSPAAEEEKSLAGLPEIARDPARLAQLLDDAPARKSANTAPDSPLLKWVKLDVLAKPTSVSLRVLDLAAQSVVRPDSLGPLSGNGQPMYSLQPNRAYAIQCLVENSRPRSQVTWFNRTAPVELEQQNLGSAGPDYLVPSAAAAEGDTHRLTSFVRYAQLESGAFRTIASLVLTTNFQDNFEELFCRVSNEAFQFDELAQVAPIISARLHVNYPPSAWLEAPKVKWTAATGAGRLSAELGQRVQMRCLVGANPLLQGAIVMIDWLKDGRRLGPAGNSTTGSSSSSNIQLEKTSHLHSPLVGPAPQLDLAQRISAASVDQQQLALAASRMLAASTLTIHALTRADAGQYSCQFRLIQMPRGDAAMGPQLQQVAGGGGGTSLTANGWPPPQQAQGRAQEPGGSQMKSIAGQANQSIQLNVIEAKLPIVQVASTSGLLVYDKLTLGASQRMNAQGPARLDRQNLEVVVVSRRARLSLRCDFAPRLGKLELGHKVLWQLNGVLLHSTSASELLELDLARPESEGAASELVARLLAGNGGRLTCAHQLLEPGSLQSQNFHPQALRLLGSSNELDLRFRVEPKLLPASRQELLMPAVRSFSELELVAQPLNRLRLVCLAQCEPLCAIEWLANGRPLRELHSAALATGELEPSGPAEPVEAREMADNLTQIFKSAQRLGSRLSDASALLELENQIHRRTLSASERFPWYKQTSLVSGALQVAPESASRQLMRDSYELIAAAGPEAMASNVFSKLELSYNQLGQMLSLASLANQREAGPRNTDEADELLLECRLSPFLDGRDPTRAQSPDGGARFGHAHLGANLFYPRGANVTPTLGVGPELEHGDLARAPLNLEPLNLANNLFEDEPDSPRAGLSSGDQFQTRILLEKSIKTDLAPVAGNFGPAPPNLQLAANSSSNFAPEQNRPLNSPQGPRVARAWLATHLDLVLVVACSAALVWLLGLFVSPLMRRHFSFARSPGSCAAHADMLKQKRASQWRFAPTGDPRRPCSSNEIGLFGSSSSSSAHKFTSSAPNYYGPPDSAAGDSSEHDMVQSSSQSSRDYEDFLQHQLAQRLAHQHLQQQQQQQQQVVQPLYFNQAQLVESTTLSRRPLMKPSYSSSSTSGETNASSSGGSRHPFAASRIYGDFRQQQQQQAHAIGFAATMRQGQAQVPLVSNSACTSSRINFSELQRQQQQQARNQERALGASSHTFGRPLVAPRAQEHIYDDVG